MFTKRVANSARTMRGLARPFSSGRVLRNEIKPVAVAPKKGLFSTIWGVTWKVSALSVLGFSGYIGYKVYQESTPKDQVPQSAAFSTGQKKKTIVILGSGWGSISLLKNLDTTLYNVVLVSPRNYFLFTPLLPSVPTGTIETRSIIEPVRSVSRRSPGEVIYYEAEATKIDPVNNKVTIKQSTTVHSGVTQKDSNSSKSTVAEHAGVSEDIVTVLDYDYLVVGVGAQPSTFGTPGVAENSCFLKEISDASKIRRQIMDCIEAANILPKGSAERARLLSLVVVGGGPTGVELAGELQDYIDQDLKKWMPEVSDELKVTVIEALPNVLNTFNKKLIDYTEEVFQETNIVLMNRTMVKKVDGKNIYYEAKAVDGTSTKGELPYGVLIWATGNAVRDVVKDLTNNIDEQKNARRGLLINDHLLVDGSKNIFAVGDCTFTKYAPTAQVAFQEGIYLGTLFKNLHKLDQLKFELASASAPEDQEKITRRLNRSKNLPEFVYKHQGALAYIGSEKAVADLVWGDWSNVSTGGSITFLFWRSAYVYMCLSIKNQILVCMDWAKVSWFGRDCSKE